MHELGLAKDLANVIFETLKKHNKNKKVNKIIIVIGEAAGVEKDFLEHSLKDHVLKGTVCENTVLEFKVEKVKIKCKQCNKEYSTDSSPLFSIQSPLYSCNCGSKDFDIVAGNEVYISEIEVE